MKRMKTDHEQPLLYHPAREEIIQQMEELADHYTPEWRFHSEHPDPGSVLVELYATMYMEMLHRYHLAPERDKQFFFQWLGLQPAPAEPSRGYVSLGVQKEAGEGMVIPAGTGLIGRGEQGNRVSLNTGTEIYASTSQIKGVYLYDGTEDRIHCLAEQEGPLRNGDCPDLQEHICRFGHSFVFPASGETELLVALELAGSKTDWDRIISDPDSTRFSYCSVQGEREFTDWECVDHRIRLKKTKDMPDFLPVNRQGKECCYLQWRAKDIHAYAGLEIHHLFLGTAGRKQPPESVYTADGEEGTGHYYPFGERPYSYGEFYLCSNEVLGRKGARIRMKLCLEFRRVALLTEPVSLPVHWKMIMRESELQEEPEVPVTIGEVVWEYYNGIEFTRLFREPLYTDCFTPADEKAVEKQMDISFYCPLDIQPFLVHAGTVYCIRVRILRMRNAFPRKGYYLSPYMTLAELEYDYRDSMQEPELCFSRNNLEEKQIHRHQSFVPFQKLADKGRSYYIGFDRKLQGGPFGLFCNVKKGGADGGKRWNYEYYNGSKWKGMTVEDGTGSLQKSGLLLLYINGRTEPGCLFGSERYWIRLVAVEESGTVRRTNGMTLREIWWNTVSVIATGGEPGREGQDNLKAGQVCQMERSIRFLNHVTNRYALTGGREMESQKEATERLSRRLLHQDRAVMLSDYEALAQEASREVVRVRAFSGRRTDAGRENGAVTIVVLSEAFDKEGFDFQEFQERIYEYLHSRMPGISQLQDRLSIIQPWFTEIQVTALCIVEPHTSAHACRTEAEELLLRFLDPLTGNFDGGGWQIGDVPGVEQIRNALYNTNGIRMIKKLVVKAYCRTETRLQELDLTGSIPGYVMITSGKHRIELEQY